MKTFRVFLRYGGSFTVRAEGIVLCGPRPRNDPDRWPGPNELGADDHIAGFTPADGITYGKGFPIHPISGVDFRGFFQPERDTFWLDGSEVIAVVEEEQGLAIS